MGRRMPQELIDMVLYTLYASPFCEDGETLKNCSLTCRAWLPASRARLFEFVQFGHPKDILSFSGILRQSPCLACYVRTLEIVAFDECVPYSDEDLDALRTIVASMDRVQCLYLTGDALSFPFLDCLPRMDSVLELNVYHADFDDIGSYTGLFAALPNVEDVDINTISAPMSDDELIPLLVVAPKLRGVRLSDGCLGAYAPLLPSALVHLTISVSNLRDLRQFCSVLYQSNAASSLTALVIEDMTGLCDDEPEPYEVDDPEPYEGLLRRCTALEYFGFHGSLTWAVSMMQSAPDSVTHVTLNFPQDSMGGFRHLATALNCERLPHLESVAVYLRKSETPGDFDATELPTIFPDLHDRGIWKLEWWDR